MQEINEEENTLMKCHNCGAEQNVDYKFCNKCGSQNINAFKKKLKRDEVYNNNLKYLARYTFILIALLIISSFTGEGFHLFVIWTICFAIIDMIFAVIQPDVWSLFNVRAIKLKPLLAIVSIALFSAFFVHFTIERLNLFLDLETYSYDKLFSGLEYSLLYAIVLLAVFPAIFEELAFRGFVFNNLKKLAGTKSAVWGSSFLFALVHFSLLSLYWLLPFGLILAYFRNRYNTIIYGIIGHFIHNSTVTLLDHFQVFQI